MGCFVGVVLFGVFWLFVLMGLACALCLVGDYSLLWMFGCLLARFGFRDCLGSVVGDVLVLVIGYGYWFRLDRGFVGWVWLWVI